MYITLLYYNSITKVIKKGTSNHFQMTDDEFKSLITKLNLNSSKYINVLINHHEFLLPLSIMIWFCAEEISLHTCLHHFWLNLWTLAHTIDIAFSRIEWHDQQVTCWTCSWPMGLYVKHLDCLFNQTDSWGSQHMKAYFESPALRYAVFVSSVLSIRYVG